MKKKNNVLILISLIIVTIVLYYPGLYGGYMLDDESSLSKLRFIDGNFTYENFKIYFAHSISGLFKRPISVFSFLINGSTWPTDPFPFKVTNLIIHLFNGALLFCIIFLIFSYSKKFFKDSLFIAFASTALWLLHPFLVSSVLYIVQRMTLLSSLFVLLGLLVYTIGRVKYEINKSSLGIVCMISATYIFPILALLSKENGILLVYYILLLEFFIFKSFLGMVDLSKRFFQLLRLPAILFTVGLIIKIPSLLSSYDIREFTVTERLMTESRALVTYLYHIFIPQYFTEGVYTDGFILSKGVLNPWTTLVSLILIISILFFAWKNRSNKPLTSFSIFFFFVGHLLESTFIPLELYFEHRNYVPMLFIFLPLAFFLNRVRKKNGVFKLIFPIILLVLSCFTLMRTSLWGDNLNLHRQTVQKFPNSVRAKLITTVIHEHNGNLSTAYNELKNASLIDDALIIKLNILNVYCVSNQLHGKHIRWFVREAKKIKLNKDDMPAFGLLFFKLYRNKCHMDNNLTILSRLVNLMEKYSHETTKNKKPLTYFFKSKFSFIQGNFKEATAFHIKSFLWNHDFDNLLLFVDDLLLNSKTNLASELLQAGKKVFINDFKYKVDWFEFGKRFNQLEMKINQQRNKTD